MIDRRLPWLRAAFARRGWELPERIERVYDSSAAAAMLGYRPQYGVESLVPDTVERRSQ